MKNVTITVDDGVLEWARVEAARQATARAGERAGGASLASDAFFPFRDGVDAAAAAGVTAIVQPGGSVRDELIGRAVAGISTPAIRVLLKFSIQDACDATGSMRWTCAIVRGAAHQLCHLT